MRVRRASSSGPCTFGAGGALSARGVTPVFWYANI